MKHHSSDIVVETFLRERGEDTGQFILARDYVGGITSPRYVAGAICLRIRDEELIGLREWDYVDQLWAYLLQCLKEIALGQVAMTHFPDQPIEVKMTPSPTGTTVRVAVDDTRKIRSADVSVKPFIVACATEADRFYGKMEELVPANAGLYAHVRREAVALLGAASATLPSSASISSTDKGQTKRGK